MCNVLYLPSAYMRISQIFVYNIIYLHSLYTYVVRLESPKSTAKNKIILFYYRSKKSVWTVPGADYNVILL